MNSNSPIKEIGLKMVQVIKRTTTLSKVTAIMEKNNIRHLPIVKETGEIEGIISQRDVLRHIDKENSGDLEAGEIMSGEVIAVDSDTPLDDVLKEMQETKIGSVLIQNDAKVICGIFTSIDAIKLLRSKLKS